MRRIDQQRKTCGLRNSYRAAADGAAAARMPEPPQPNSKAQRDMASVIQRLESMYEVAWDSDEEVR